MRKPYPTDLSPSKLPLGVEYSHRSRKERRASRKTGSECLAAVQRLYGCTPGEQRVSLEDVRHLTLRYSRARPEKMEVCVEYVGGRVRVFEVDQWLLERILRELDDGDIVRIGR